MAQYNCFNRMVGKKIIWQNILKKPNDAMCQILRLPHVNILVCIIVTSVIANVIVRIHPLIHIKSPYSYSTKKYFIYCL